MEKNKFPGINKVEFKIQLDSNRFSKGEIISSNYKDYLAEVMESPHKKWWKKLLQFITFGLYKAPYQYKIKLL